MIRRLRPIVLCILGMALASALGGAKGSGIELVLPMQRGAQVEHSQAAFDGTWSPDGKEYVGVLRWAQAVCTWDTQTWAMKRVVEIKTMERIDDYTRILFSPNAKYAILQKTRQRVFDLATGSEVPGIGPGGPQGYYSFSSDSNLTIRGQRTISMRSLPSGKTISSIEIPARAWAESLPNDLYLIPSEPGKADVWDLKTGTRAKTVCYDTSTDQYKGRYVSPDAKLEVQYGGKTARLLDMETGKVLQTFTNDAEIVEPVATSPDGDYLFAYGDDPSWKSPGFAATESAYRRKLRLLVWDVRKGEQVLKQPDRYTDEDCSFEFVGDTTLLIAYSAGAETGALAMWSIPDMKLVKKASVGDTICGVWGLSPDHTKLASGFSVYEWPDGKKVRTLIPQDCLGFQGCSLTPNGKLLLTGSYGTVLVWDLAHWGIMGSVPFCGPNFEYLRGTSLIITRQASGLANSERPGNVTSSLTVVDPATGKTVKSIPYLYGQLTPDGRKIVATANGGLQVYDAQTSKLLRTIPSGTRPTSQSSPGFSPNGRWALTGPDLGVGMAVLYDLASGTARPLSHYRERTAVFSPDSSALAYMEEMPNKAYRWVIWDLAKKRARGYIDLKRGKQYGAGISFSPDSRRIIVWDAADGYACSASDLKSKSPLTLAIETAAICWHPNGRLIFCSEPDGLVVRNARSGKQLLTLNVTDCGEYRDFDWRQAKWIAYTPDGQYDGSPGIEDLTVWRVNGKLVLGSDYKAGHRQPGLVAKVLGGNAH